MLDKVHFGEGLLIISLQKIWGLFQRTIKSYIDGQDIQTIGGFMLIHNQLLNFGELWW